MFYQGDKFYKFIVISRFIITFRHITLLQKSQYLYAGFPFRNNFLLSFYEGMTQTTKDFHVKGVS